MRPNGDEGLAKKKAVSKKRAVKKIRATKALKAAPQAMPFFAAEKKQGLDFGAMVNLWVAAVANPEATLAHQRTKGGFSKGIIMLSLAGALYALICALLTANVFLLVFGPITFAIGVPIFALVYSVIIYAFAKVLGGKGGLREQFHLFAVFLSPILLLMALAKIMYVVPMLGYAIKNLIVLLLGIYALYQLTVSLKIVHGFGNLKAVLTWLLPGLIVAFLIAVFAIVVMAMLLATIPAAALVGLLG